MPSPEMGLMRTLEFRLLHQYVTATAGTMNSVLPRVRRMWDISVPQMAFEYEPLLCEKDRQGLVAAWHPRARSAWNQ
jgi:hypothetical protein